MPKGTVKFAQEYCKGCYLCVAFCPVKILKPAPHQLNSKGYPLVDVITPERCIGCGFCALMCPDAVITVTKEVEEPKHE
ncbi:MAG: 4Fe-4S binding protein [Erysipelotrichaceae bacterium]|jgi:2-oxoglutarate ferredoxin oxidoreductase subunit delta|nr:4Fe-4S binding protein [Erysipelotrichaceae bacterium]